MGRCATVTSALTPGRPFGSGTAVPTGGDCAGSIYRQMLNVVFLNIAGTTIALRTMHGSQRA
jgi:hypothetical protein